MFELACPWILLACIWPLFAWKGLPPATRTSPAALYVPFFNQLTLQTSATHKRQRLSLWLSMVWVFLVFAASGPRWVGAPEPLTREGHNIMLALDISGSMALDDMTWQGQPSTRLNVVKHAAHAFIRQRKGDRLGLILFGSRAYLQTPLTHDKSSILSRLEDATVGLAGKATSLGDPIGLAIKHLKHTPSQGRLLILLTDGANNTGLIAPIKAAELARTEGIKIYTIGLGSAQNMQTLFGPIGGMDLDEDTLKSIAKTTGGHYFRATNQASLQRIYQLINAMETVPQEEASIRPQHDYYPWPLGCAFFLFLGGLLYETGISHQLIEHGRKRRIS